MDFTIIIGIAIAIGMLIDVIGTGATAALFLSREALIIVGGGLMAATFVQFPWDQIKQLIPRMRILFYSRKRNHRSDIILLLKLSRQMHSGGRLSLEKEIDNIKDPFMQHAMKMVMDKVPAEQIKLMLIEMINHSENRHEQGIYYFEQLAKYAPGFALVGTLCGLVKLLSNISDPKSIGPNMATALVSTFYGVTLSNLVFLPLAGRLKVASYEERLHKEVLIEGITAMANNELPYNIREKVYMIITEKDRVFLKTKES
jgi:chemotaxis protein MotA